MGGYFRTNCKAIPDIKGSGIPTSRIATSRKDGYELVVCLLEEIRRWSDFIGSGLLLGREGPSIQLGASVGQGVAEPLRPNRVQKMFYFQWCRCRTSSSV